MDIYRGKIALVTGASSGIGSVTAKRLVSHGLKVLSHVRFISYFVFWYLVDSCRSSVEHLVMCEAGKSEM